MEAVRAHTGPVKRPIPQSPVAPQPAMVDLLQRVTSISERLALATDRCGRFLNRCHGPQPESCGEAELRPVSNGHFDAIFDQLRTVEASVNQLENVADALDRIG